MLTLGLPGDQRPNARQPPLFRAYGMNSRKGASSRSFAAEPSPLPRTPALMGPMDRIPNATDLTAAELASLTLVCRGFILRTIPPAHEARLVKLGLIQSMMGGLIITPAGKMLARA
jgi:hypothetical protein